MVFDRDFFQQIKPEFATNVAATSAEEIKTTEVIPAAADLTTENKDDHKIAELRETREKLLKVSRYGFIISFSTDPTDRLAYSYSGIEDTIKSLDESVGTNLSTPISGANYDGKFRAADS